MVNGRFTAAVLLLAFPLLLRASPSELGGEADAAVAVDWCAWVDAIILGKNTEQEKIAALADCVRMGEDINKVRGRLRGARCIASGGPGDDAKCEDFDCRLRICSRHGRVVSIEYFPLSGGHRRLIGEW